MIEYLRRTPSVRDVVVSGGDVANMPWRSLDTFVIRLLDPPLGAGMVVPDHRHHGDRTGAGGSGPSVDREQV